MLSANISQVQFRQFDLVAIQRTLGASNKGKEAFAAAVNAAPENFSDEFRKAVRTSRVGAILAGIEASNDPDLKEIGERLKAIDPDDLAMAMIRANEPDDVLPWLEGFVRSARTVCEVFVPTVGRATGFLIGPDLVLTANHVISNIVDDETLTLTILPQVIFDRQARADRSSHTAGVVYEVAPKLVHRSLEYDYAVIRIADAAGRAADQGGHVRGWINLFDEALIGPGFYVGVIHHPEATRLLFSPGAVIRDLSNTDNRRVQYTARTEVGSSGAPVFDSNWRIMAMHAGIDGEDPLNPEFTEGIPISSIREDLEQEMRISRDISPVDRFLRR